MSQAEQKYSSIEDKLKAMRKGYEQDIVVKYGDLDIPMRLMTATEEHKITATARLEARKTSVGLSPEEASMNESLTIMKYILLEGSTIGKSTAALPMQLLNLLTSAEIGALYDGYLDVCMQVDKAFEDLSPGEIESIVHEVKKNPEAAKSYSTRQLKGIGKYFLETLLPAVNLAGG